MSPTARRAALLILSYAFRGVSSLVRSVQFKSFPFTYHEELELTIDRVSNSGNGVAGVLLPSSSRRWVVVVPFVLPGEIVRARIVHNYARYSQAELMHVSHPSPLRQSPPCPLFGTCGGCVYQHVPYVEQLRWKASQVVDVLQRIGRIDPESIHVGSTIGSPLQWHYRSKLTPQLGPDAVGFAAAGSPSSLVDVPSCLLASEPINEALSNVRDSREASALTLQPDTSLLLRYTPHDGVVFDPTHVLTEDVGSLRFRFQARDFFQTNPSILPALIEYVLEQARGELSPARAHVAADATADDALPVHPTIEYLIDAYCGVGLFAIAAARFWEHGSVTSGSSSATAVDEDDSRSAYAPLRTIVGVEVSASSIDAARGNAELNGVSHVRFLAAAAERIFDDLEFHAEGSRSAVIVDPPRKGCSEAFLSQLCDFAPRRIIYVSCSPDTQARDLRTLLDAGYTLERVQPFDLFPHTRHLESVATLEWLGAEPPMPVICSSKPRAVNDRSSKRRRRADKRSKTKKKNCVKRE